MKKILHNFLSTAKQVRLRFEAKLAEAGGSVPIWLVLNTLQDSEGMTQTQLAERIHIECPTLTRHLDRLEASDLIERRNDPEDRRITRIYLTAKGCSLHSELLAVAERFEAQLIENLTDVQVAHLNQVFDQIRINFDKSYH